MKDRHLIHLHWRSGFGITPSSLKSAKLLSKQNNVNSIFDISKKIELIQLDLSEFDQFLKTPYKKYKNIHGEEAATKLRQKSQRKVRELNFEWLKKIASSDCVFREKMTLFWANVFVCRDNHILHIIQFNNTLRKHALGDFGAFCKSSCKNTIYAEIPQQQPQCKAQTQRELCTRVIRTLYFGSGEFFRAGHQRSGQGFYRLEFLKPMAILL